jgi:hypothetical protein
LKERFFQFRENCNIFALFAPPCAITSGFADGASVRENESDFLSGSGQ